MARRKAVDAPVVPADSPDAPPPLALLRFKPSQAAPMGPYGRPEPWRVKWTADEFTAFLRARTAWRAVHTEPLPGLPARERLAMRNLGLPEQLIEAEADAPRRPPLWQ